MKIEFEIPNPLVWIRKKIALYKFRKKIAKDINYIMSEVNKSNDTIHRFKWTHLVIQEIGYWIRIGRLVKQEEFDFICNRRGFDAAMIRYLFDMMKYIGLGKHLKYIPAAKS